MCVTLPSTIRAALSQGEVPFVASDCSDETNYPGLTGPQSTWPAAAQKLRQAMEDGYTPAKAKYALCLLWGRGVNVDKTAAVRLLREAAATGDSLARIELFHCVNCGNGTRRDSAAALEMLEHWAKDDLAVRRFLGQHHFRHGNFKEATKYLAGL